MRRRQFIHLLGAAAAWPLAAQVAKSASRDRVARIGVLWHAGSEDEEREYYSVLLQAFRDLGIDIIGGSPDDFAAYIKAEIPKWSAIVKASGAHLD